MTKNIIKYLIKHPADVRWINDSFSQEGEDIILDGLLQVKEKGFYVDLGSYHPVKYSNTLKFYLRGWNGINVDATPGSMKIFDKIRNRDINVETAISDVAGEMTYYQFNEPALNTFDSSVLRDCEEAGYKLISKKTVLIRPIMEVLDTYVPRNQQIDFMDIDVEGLDEKIIDAIDWKKYHPTIVLTEKKTAERENGFAVNMTLINYGYSLVACTGRTAIYLAQNK